MRWTGEISTAVGQPIGARAIQFCSQWTFKFSVNLIEIEWNKENESDGITLNLSTANVVIWFEFVIWNKYAK